MACDDSDERKNLLLPDPCHGYCPTVPSCIPSSHTHTRTCTHTKTTREDRVTKRVQRKLRKRVRRSENVGLRCLLPSAKGRHTCTHLRYGPRMNDPEHTHTLTLMPRQYIHRGEFEFGLRALLFEQYSSCRAPAAPQGGTIVP